MKSFLLNYERPTDVLKQRYARKVDDEIFRVYLMDIRTPKKPPENIKVTLGETDEINKKEIYTYGELLKDKSLCNNPVYDELIRHAPCVHSRIYITRQEKERIDDKFKVNSFEEKKEKEKPTYGYTYIPYNVLDMTFGKQPEELAMQVDWI